MEDAEVSMNRRGFLSGIIASCAAPAIITTPGLLMPVRSIERPLTLGDIARLQQGVTWEDPSHYITDKGWRDWAEILLINWPA